MVLEIEEEPENKQAQHGREMENATGFGESQEATAWRKSSPLGESRGRSQTVVGQE